MTHNQSLTASPPPITSPEQYLNIAFSYEQTARTYVETTPSTGDDGVFYDEPPYIYDHMDSNLMHSPDQVYGHEYQNQGRYRPV
jgi:hypothetical protein